MPDVCGVNRRPCVFVFGGPLTLLPLGALLCYAGAIWDSGCCFYIVACGILFFVYFKVQYSYHHRTHQQPFHSSKGKAKAKQSKGKSKQSNETVTCASFKQRQSKGKAKAKQSKGKERQRQSKGKSKAKCLLLVLSFSSSKRKTT